MAEQRPSSGGFVQIPWTAIQALTDPELKVFAVLTHYSTMQYGAFPSIDTIAKATGKRRRAISGILSRLKKRGFIEVIPRNGRASLYRVWSG